MTYIMTIIVTLSTGSIQQHEFFVKNEFQCQMTGSVTVVELLQSKQVQEANYFCEPLKGN